MTKGNLRDLLGKQFFYFQSPYIIRDISKFGTIIAYDVHDPDNVIDITKEQYDDLQRQELQAGKNLRKGH